MNNAFAVPDQYGGMSLQDIFGKVSGNGGYTPDLGTLSSLTGLNPTQKLTAGQQVVFGKNDPGSGEYKFLNSNFTPYSQAQSNKFDSFYTGQKNDITDYLGRLQTGTAANQSKAYGDFNVPLLQGNAGALASKIQTLRTNADNSGAGGFASQNQVNGADSQLGTKLGIASTAASSAATAANQEFNNLQAPLTTEGTMLNDRLARESTGFTADQQRQLDLLITQLNNGVTLTKTQMDNANALAQQEQVYQEKLANPGTQIVTVGGVQKLINSQTGAVIASLGSSSVGGTSNPNSYYNSNAAVSSSSTGMNSNGFTDWTFGG